MEINAVQGLPDSTTPDASRVVVSPTVKPFTPLYNIDRTGQMRSFIYMIRSGEFLKIGIADDLAKRVEALALGNPHGLKVMAYRTVPRPLAKQLEQRLHAHFADRAIGREWFRDLDHKEVCAVLKPMIRPAERFLRDALRKWTDY